MSDVLQVSKLHHPRRVFCFFQKATWTWAAEGSSRAVWCRASLRSCFGVFCRGLSAKTYIHAITILTAVLSLSRCVECFSSAGSGFPQVTERHCAKVKVLNVQQALNLNFFFNNGTAGLYLLHKRRENTNFMVHNLLSCRFCWNFVWILFSVA